MFCFQEKNGAPPPCSGRLSARRRPKDRTGPLPSSGCGNSAGSSHIRLTEMEKAVVLKGPNRSVPGGKNQLWLYCCCHFVLSSSSWQTTEMHTMTRSFVNWTLGGAVAASPRPVAGNEAQPMVIPFTLFVKGNLLFRTNRMRTPNTTD